MQTFEEFWKTHHANDSYVMYGAFARRMYNNLAQSEQTELAQIEVAQVFAELEGPMYFGVDLDDDERARVIKYLSGIFKDVEANERINRKAQLAASSKPAAVLEWATEIVKRWYLSTFLPTAPGSAEETLKQLAEVISRYWHLSEEWASEVQHITDVDRFTEQWLLWIGIEHTPEELRQHAINYFALWQHEANLHVQTKAELIRLKDKIAETTIEIFKSA